MRSPHFDSQTVSVMWTDRHLTQQTDMVQKTTTAVICSSLTSFSRSHNRLFNFISFISISGNVICDIGSQELANIPLLVLLSSLIAKLPPKLMGDDVEDVSDWLTLLVVCCWKLLCWCVSSLDRRGRTRATTRILPWGWCGGKQQWNNMEATLGRQAVSEICWTSAQAT